MKKNIRKERIVLRKLRTLNKLELAALSKYIQSKVNSDLFLSFSAEVLRLMGAKGESSTIESSILGKWPKLDKKKLNVLFLELHDALKEYIVFRSTENKTVVKILEEFQLLEFYRRKSLGEFFEKSADTIDALFVEYGKKDSFYFEKVLRLAEERAEFYDNSIYKGRYVQELSNSLDLFYFVRKLNISIVMVNFAKNIYNVEFDFGMLSSVSAYLDKHAHSEPVVNLYRNVLNLLQSDGDIVIYKQLNAFIESNVGVIPKEQLLVAISVLSNTTFRVAKDRKEFYVLIFELYQFQIKHELLSVYKNLRIRLFENIVKAGLQVEGTVWARKFIEDFQDRLEPKGRIVSIALNQARCDFADKKFESCLKHLLSIEKKKCEVFVNLDRRRLQIQAYFELDQTSLSGDPNQPERAIGSLKKFLHTKKSEIAEEHATANLDFVRFVNRMIEANDDKRRAKLISEIQSTNVLPHKDWMLQTLGVKEN